MEGTAIAGIVTGIGGSITAIATALINRGTAEGVKELKAELHKLNGPDGEFPRLKKRVDEIEGAIATAVTLAGIPAEVTALRAHIESQLKAARQDWDTWQRRAQRTATTSQPALIDEAARRDVAEAQHDVTDAIRRITELERARKDDRDSAVALQVQLTRVETLLDLILGDTKIQIGGKTR